MAQKYYDLTKPSDIEEVRRLLEEDDEENDPTQNDDFGEESDVDSHDEVEERKNDSETEQDGEETEDENETERETIFILGKDKTTKWTTNPPKTSIRIKPHNIKTHLPGVIGKAKEARTAADCWNNLFTDDILETIVKYTNQYIDQIKLKYARERDIVHTDIIELRAFIGLLFLAGALRSNRQSLEELWGKDGDGVEKFGLVMSIKRFKTLIRCLRFDDRRTRAERKTIDRLAPIRDVFEKFVENCQKSYSVGENVTIDEMLPGFRGRCSFRQYMPSKPNKYGIKLFALVDAVMFYVLNMEIYAGKQPEGPFYVSNKPSEVVKRMAKPIFGSGRNITADNWFTDIELIEDLKEKRLSYVGTVRKNKQQLPAEFISVKGKKQFSSTFAFSNGKTLVSYIPKPNKNVLLLSSLHDDNSIDPGSGEQMKPEIITFYNSTKGGVDTADQLCANYSVSRKVKRWPMVIFFSMLNVSGINSQVIYLGNNQKSLRRRIFLKTLAHELMLGELTRRSVKTVGMPTSLQNRLKRYRPVEDLKENADPAPRKRRRCETCTTETGLRRLSNYQCIKCQNAICLAHANMICGKCWSMCHCPSAEVDESSESE